MTLSLVNRAIIKGVGISYSNKGKAGTTIFEKKEFMNPFQSLKLHGDVVLAHMLRMINT